MFSTSPPQLSAHSAPLQVGEVVTRLAPSQRVPGLSGVYLTKAVRKFHHIEVLPAAATATSLSSSDPSSQGSSLRNSPRADNTPLAGGSTVPPCRGPDGTTLAPPLVLNLAFAPRHHISLRRFLALRHMFSSNAYLHAATEQGWYLIAPSSAAPLCADVAGLEKWVHLHHHRYLQPVRASSSRQSRDRRASSGHEPTASAGQARVLSPREARLAKHAELAELEAALDNGEELTESQLRALADKESGDAEKGGDSEDVAEQEEKTRRVDAGANTASALWKMPSAAASEPAVGGGTVPTAALAPQLKAVPPLITEAHLFEINDGVLWELPSPDDLASHDYWKGHRQRMVLYESTGDADAAEQREALLSTIRGHPRARMYTEQELYAAAEKLFQAFKQKANVRLSVDAESGLLSLVPLVDLEAGDELFLHYGREWWTGRLLSSLLLAVPDEEMGHIRWIEQLFGHEADRNQLFPLLMPAYQQRKHKRSRRRSSKATRPSAHVHESSAGEPRSDAQGEAMTNEAHASVSAEARRGPLVLFNTVTHSKATDAAVLAFAVRRSCVDQTFFDRLVLGSPGRRVRPLFSLSEPDAEIPMSALRKVLLASLRGVLEEGVVTDADFRDAVGHSTNAASQGGDTSGGADGGPSDRIDDDDVFSV
ncbi:hypothetical protein ABL78_6528 [Leptomonas seymouri]|uniref:SET domain-containing protein n=1 Tax=Leptomonas seymouri TaxID=5684 RepID=A0A0N1I0P8_LEPSE|nr:hypothetical protein ABL78_6528 [Leptomonas seymouri]|eukprot:KPI84421.1 hypothetical protein ABL78_6528 [Leptomonas seymouri]